MSNTQPSFQERQNSVLPLFEAAAISQTPEEIRELRLGRAELWLANVHCVMDGGVDSVPI